jgi:hypothetical protein
MKRHQNLTAMLTICITYSDILKNGIITRSELNDQPDNNSVNNGSFWQPVSRV